MRLWPFYPAAIAAAFVLAVYSDAAALPSDLTRPLVSVTLIALAIQVVTTVILRDRDRGALVAAVVISAIPTQPVVLVAFVVIIATLILPGRLARARGSIARPIPWQATTHLLNLAAVIVLVISTGQLIADGRLAPSRSIAEARRTTAEGGPDIYVIILDGHPRWDSLANEFGIDPEPFLGAMETQGFEVARHSRSNYNMTELTFASMFQMKQLHDVPGFDEIDSNPMSFQRRSLGLEGLIARGPALDELHRHGYEVVGIPSEFSEVAPPADRLFANGNLSDLELSLLVESRLRTLTPDLLRSAAAAQHRDRVRETLRTLKEIAEERAVGPRFVFAHILSPHSPLVFGPGGEPRDGWPCFPSLCTFWGDGEAATRGATVAARGDQVGYLDSIVLETVRSIVATSHRSPVIIVMSDHGSRYEPTEHAEMLRSLFLARTPGRPGLFPADMTPVNLIPRLLNAYAGADLPMSTEESYWTDIDAAINRAQLDLIPIDPDGPTR